MAGRKREYEAPDLAAASKRMMRALVRRAEGGELEALEALHALQADLAVALQDAVDGYRTGPAEASWAAIGRALGTSRQAAQMRFSATSSSKPTPNEADALLSRAGEVLA